MPDLNSGVPIKFEHGGQLLIDGDPVKNIMPGGGSLVVTGGGWERLGPDIDQGVMSTSVRAGVPQETRATLRIKTTAGQALFNLTRAAPVAGLHVSHAVGIKIYDSQAATTGDILSLPNAVFETDRCDLSPGQQHDELVLAMMQPSAGVLFTAFTDS